MKMVLSSRSSVSPPPSPFDAVRRAQRQVLSSSSTWRSIAWRVFLYPSAAATSPPLNQTPSPTLSKRSWAECRSNARSYTLSVSVMSGGRGSEEGTGESSHVTETSLVLLYAPDVSSVI